MGLHIMNYRAKTIGGALRIQRCAEGGTAVTCMLQSLADTTARADISRTAESFL
jgi:nitrate/nitrite-specific signal transduction histidine kinase